MRAVFRKTPVPMMVPTTNAVVALKSNPRTSSRLRCGFGIHAGEMLRFDGRQHPIHLLFPVNFLRQLH
jgi:class 3 adenylate cyclase